MEKKTVPWLIRLPYNLANKVDHFIELKQTTRPHLIRALLTLWVKIEEKKAPEGEVVPIIPPETTEEMVLTAKDAVLDILSREEPTPNVPTLPDDYDPLAVC